MAQATERVRTQEDERAAKEPSPLPPAPRIGEDLIPDDPFAAVRRQMIDAVQRFDPQVLERLLQSVSYTARASLIFDKILAPVMVEVGELWHAGEVSVGQEHMATFLLEGTMRNLLSTQEYADEARTAVLGCAETEEHTLPLFGVAFHAARWGYRPVMLGARTPASALKSAIEGLNPAFVGLSMTVPPAPHQLRQMIEAYIGCCGDVPLVLGGIGAVELRSEIIALGAHCPVDTSIDAFRDIVSSDLVSRRA
jgi:methanogenic corrinoid protein MtbC1